MSRKITLGHVTLYGFTSLRTRWYGVPPWKSRRLLVAVHKLVLLPHFTIWRVKHSRHVTSLTNCRTRRVQPSSSSMRCRFTQICNSRSVAFALHGRTALVPALEDRSSAPKPPMDGALWARHVMFCVQQPRAVARLGFRRAGGVHTRRKTGLLVFFPSVYMYGCMYLHPCNTSVRICFIVWRKRSSVPARPVHVKSHCRSSQPPVKS
jgi:hypothetical protein